MPPPGKRRPGYDRKAQYGLFASYVIALAGAALGLLLLMISIADPTGFAALRSVAAEITRPVSSGLRTVVVGIGNLDEAVAAYINAGAQNAALLRQVEANRTRLIEAEAIRQENARLKRLLRLTESETGVVSAGHLISSTSSSAARLARLDIGRARGVQPGMPVRAPEGLVGRVLRAGPNSSDVLLLIDEGNVVPVRRTTDNIPGISSGRGDGTVEIRALNTERNPFKPGDILVTSGIGGIYRPNIPVAVVARLEGDRAVAFPLANPSRVELVLVQTPYRPAEAAREAAAREVEASNAGAE
ncbi:rod shape-determining protein MreC [Sphingobium sp. SYK-6]|uniref:rod shape-determining protein MreC n=1 Tax=Sphingobium sp. (strain NBRC 103272 / SYK-6) TaxID=627192 RepID=UPI0002277126|nr:rod shape-determining protein MreC [Sphingobium sp. SYK-6]BAK66389.1 rod shape-determining protein MreC [Sphingobium sp. SYK-6]